MHDEEPPDERSQDGDGETVVPSQSLSERTGPVRGGSPGGHPLLLGIVLFGLVVGATAVELAYLSQMRWHSRRSCSPRRPNSRLSTSWIGTSSHRRRLTELVIDGRYVMYSASFVSYLREEALNWWCWRPICSLTRPIRSQWRGSRPMTSPGAGPTSGPVSS